MSDLVVGLSTGCFFQTSIFDCLEIIRQAGFELIEVCSLPTHLDYHDSHTVQEARRRMDQLGIEPYSFHAPFAEAIDITALDPHRRHDAVAELLYAAEAAAILGVRYMVVHPGPERGGFPDNEGSQRLQNALGALAGVAETCRRCKMTLVLENMLPHLFLGGMRDLLWIADALAGKGVGICLDTGHAFLAGDLLTNTRAMGQRLRMIHAHDNRGGYDDHLPPGEGKIAWKLWWKEIVAIGFHGPIILEIAGRADIHAVLDDAIRGVKYMEGLIKEFPPADA